MLNDSLINEPVTPPDCGVIVKFTVTGAFVVLVSEPLIGEPVPLAAIPVTATLLSLVQLKTVPGNVLDKTIGSIEAPEQMICEDGVTITSGVGLTVTTVAIEGADEQPLADTTTV